MRVSQIIISVILSTVVTSRAYSVTRDLFDQAGHPVGNIDKTTIHAGDILKFGDGNRYQVISYLGEGSVNLVLKVRMLSPSPGVPKLLALRLPKTIEVQPGKLSPQELISSYISGYKLLQQEAVPIPKMFKSLNGQYVASELIESDFDGETFFIHPELLEKKYSTEVLQEAEDALVRFARTTFRFNNIGDIGPGQLVYNVRTQSWTLLDWSNSHELIESHLNKLKSHTFKERFESGLIDVSEEDRRALTPREKLILRRLKPAIIAARKASLYVKCLRKAVTEQ